MAAGWAGVWHMRRTAHPLIQFDVLTQRTFAIVIWGGSLFRLAISVSPFLLPLMFQVAFGLSAFQSGLLVLAMFAGNLFMKPATTPITVPMTTDSMVARKAISSEICEP